MVELGKILKQHRIDQDKTIADISDDTKMNINIILNIESGNINYFNNDLTYLKFYLRSYCRAINLDFNDIEEEFNNAILSHTQSISLLEKQKYEDLNKQIKTKKMQMGGYTTSSKAKRIDWTLLSLISIVSLIVAFLGYSLITSFIEDKNNNDNKPPIVDNDKDKDTDKDEDPDDIVEVVDVDLSYEDDYTVVLNNYDNNLEIKTKFNVLTWVQIKVNNQVVRIPNENVNSKTFAVSEELIIPITYFINEEEKTLQEGDVISIRYGIMNSNEFYVNDQLLNLKDNVANALGGTDLVYKLEKMVQQ